jgi:hypothetical protein
VLGLPLAWSNERHLPPLFPSCRRKSVSRRSYSGGNSSGEIAITSLLRDLEILSLTTGSFSTGLLRFPSLHTTTRVLLPKSNHRHHTPSFAHFTFSRWFHFIYFCVLSHPFLQNFTPRPHFSHLACLFVFVDIYDPVKTMVSHGSVCQFQLRLI